MTGPAALPTLPALACLGDLRTVRPVVVIDTREQAPLPFHRLEAVRGRLQTGDYDKDLTRRGRSAHGDKFVLNLGAWISSRPGVVVTQDEAHPTMSSPFISHATTVPLCSGSLAESESTLSSIEKLEAARWFRDEVQPHESALRAYLRARFSSLTDIDDIVQESYLRLLRVREEGKVQVTRAYLFVTARNAALDLLRRKRIIAIDSLDQMAPSTVVEEGANAADQLSHAEEIKLLDDAVRDLPPRCREIVTLRRLHGLSHHAIARRLGIAESTVHAQLCIGLKRCRQYLCNHGVALTCIHDPANPSTAI